MRDYIEERIYQAAAYIIENGATVRDAAKVLKISKSTVHKVVKSGKTCMGAIKFADVNGELLSAQRRSPDIPLEHFHNLSSGPVRIVHYRALLKWMSARSAK